MSIVPTLNSQIETIVPPDLTDSQLENMANPVVLRNGENLALTVIIDAIEIANPVKSPPGAYTPAEEFDPLKIRYKQDIKDVTDVMLKNPVLSARIVSMAGVAAASYLNLNGSGLRRSDDLRIKAVFPHLSDLNLTAADIRSYVGDRISDVVVSQPFSKQNRKRRKEDVGLEYYAPCPTRSVKNLKKNGDLYLGSGDYESLERMLAFMQDVEPFAKSRNPNLVDVEKRAVFLALKDILSTYRNALNSGDERPAQLSQYPEFRNLLPGNVQQLKDAQKRRNPNI